MQKFSVQTCRWSIKNVERQWFLKFNTALLIHLYSIDQIVQFCAHSFNLNKIRSHLAVLNNLGRQDFYKRCWNVFILPNSSKCKVFGSKMIISQPLTWIWLFIYRPDSDSVQPESFESGGIRTGVIDLGKLQERFWGQKTRIARQLLEIRGLEKVTTEELFSSEVFSPSLSAHNMALLGSYDRVSLLAP